ncbi:MAG: DUF2254 domain-containing protein [Actinomycetota bacterium]|nr:DUF2254 domain-containing protein [Actinomycetota bacterium]
MEKLSSAWDRLNSSFWFLPALMTVGAVALFFGAQYLDQVSPTSLADLPVVFSGGASAARSVLESISGSLITVIATAFSLTIVTFVLASGQYTPRLLKSLTADRGLQVVLGSYIATFVYSLLVLRIVRESDGEGDAFVPVISVSLAVVLALACVGLLIYFIQHVTNLIQPSTIFQRIHDETMKPIAELDDLDASGVGRKGVEDRTAARGLPAGVPSVVRSRKVGYVQRLDVDAIVDAVAVGGETRVVEIPFGPGCFVASGLPVARVWPARKAGLGRDAADEAWGAFVFGKERSSRHDFTFGLRQLTDIALAGLSPSFNDPTTAMQAMDRTEDILIALGTKALPRRVQQREVGGGRVLVKIGYPGFEDVVELAFDQAIRAAFATGQVVFLRRVLEIVERALGANDLPERRQSLWARAFDVGYLAPRQLPYERDAVTLVLRIVEVGAPLLGTELSAAVGSDLEELARVSEDLRGGERVRQAVDAAWEGLKR